MMSLEILRTPVNLLRFRRVHFAGDEIKATAPESGVKSPFVVDFTDLDGQAVPIEQLEEAREVEGLSEAEFYKRGVVLGDEAWGVIEAWIDNAER
jgi:hypothetical protein